MNLRTVAFASARSYFTITLLLLACYATSFIAAYLLPAAIVSLAASLLFVGAGVLCPTSPKSTDQRNESPRHPSDTQMVSTTRGLGVTPAERN